MKMGLKKSYDPTQLDESEILHLVASGLISYMEAVLAGEADPFPYPEALVRGFNQLSLACALQDVARQERPASIPQFVREWGQRPLLDWPLKLKLLQEVLTQSDRLLDPECDGRPTQLCYQLGKGTLS
jgi:hypothetical protein